jgi:large subunit ribosomal protein L4
MVKVSVKNLAGKEVREATLPEAFFGLPANDALVHQVYVALSGNRRQAIAHTKDRSERRGSGKKPWRQKGTGRARVGEVRTPIWRKGGVVFGPLKERNYAKATTKKMRQKAVMIALSEKIRNGKCLLLEDLAFAEPKTKLFAAALKALGIEGRSLLAGFAPEEFETARLMRNIPKTAATLSENVNVYDLLNHEYFIMTEASVEALEKRFAKWA